MLNEKSNLKKNNISYLQDHRPTKKTNHKLKKSTFRIASPKQR